MYANRIKTYQREVTKRLDASFRDRGAEGGGGGGGGGTCPPNICRIIKKRSLVPPNIESVMCPSPPPSNLKVAPRSLQIVIGLDFIAQ